MNVTKIMIKAALLSGLALALAVIVIGMLVWFLGGEVAAFGGFGLVAIAGIPLWMFLILIIGIPTHFLLMRLHLTEYRHYANAAVIAVFAVISLICYFVVPRSGLQREHLVEFLVLTGIVSLLTGVPVGLLFRRLVACTLPPGSKL